MEFNAALIKHALSHVLFINGTACAGKSTMVRMLAERYELTSRGENYDCVPDGMVTPDKYPNISYFKTMSDWGEFVSRTPAQYDAWIKGCSRELVEFEILHLMRIPPPPKVIVDTNIPPDVLRQIAGYNQVAIMLAPPALSVEQFFNRDDPDKRFILEQINRAPDPEWTMRNYRECIKMINSQENYDVFANSGFFTLVRSDAITDTREETLAALARHFGLSGG